jgi:hypothetical protein
MLLILRDKPWLWNFARSGVGVDLGSGIESARGWNRRRQRRHRRDRHGMHRDAAVTTQGDGDRKHLSSIDALPYDFLSPSRHFVVDTSSVLAKSRAPGVSAAIALEKGFNGDVRLSLI